MTPTCTQWLPAHASVCGASGDVRPFIQGLRCGLHRPGQPIEEPATGTPLRPAGHGTGLDGPVCPQRYGNIQTPRSDTAVRARLCGDGIAWCGGVLPEVTPVRHLAVVR